ncbi:MAG: ABC transporter permease [Oscillospiraceae bacterium]|nr:ABC transporter permease [Oscillospiraceae bacterium]
MNIFMAFKMAVDSVWSSKIRSLLTMLGIIIGVASVIILVNIVTAATLSMRTQLESMGTNLIQVTINNRGWGQTRSVSVKDIEQLTEENADLFSAVSPVVSGMGTIKYGTENVNTSITGVSETYIDIRSLEVEEGRFISENDIDNRSNVVVIGEYIRKQLFGTESPVGQTVKINNEKFTVIGLLKAASTNSSAGSSDDVMLLPYSRATRLVRNANINSFVVSAVSSDYMSEATDAIDNFLYKKFKSDDSYFVFNTAELIDTIDDALGVMSLLMAGIAGISLVVGGIGIMNIMLVTVTERTREIGIRKSIGAKRKSIITQFLIESAVISCIGGIIGIVVGVVGSYFVCRAMDMGAVPLSEQATVILGSFAFSALIGIFFGLYPANKAAKLNPIDALRND